MYDSETQRQRGMLDKRLTVTRSLQAVAIATMLFSAVTSFDALHRYIELFSHFRLQYLAASLLLLPLFAFALKKPNYLILLLFATALNASFVLPWYWGDPPLDRPVALKLLHANVLSTNNEFERLLQLVDTEQADVVCLLEVNGDWYEATRHLLQDYPYSHFEPRDDNFGIALLSRIPLDSLIVTASPPLDYPTIVATMTVAGEPLTLISTHAANPLGRANFEARNTHLESVAQIARRTAGAVLLTGDFNTGVWGSHYRALEQRSGLENASRGFGIVPTWPTFFPIAMIPIDHALVSKEIGVVEIRTGPHIGSDHLPLIVEIAVAKQSE